MIVAGLMLAGVFAVIFAVAGRLHGAALSKAEGPAPHIVEFELAGTGKASYDFLAATGPTGRSAIRSAIRIDTWVIVGYAPGLAVLALLSTRVISWSSAGTAQTLGVVVAIAMAIAALTAGALDLRENDKLIAILDLWSDAPVGPSDRGEAKAAIEQQHRRDLIERFDRPSAAAKRSAVIKFLLAAIVALGWGLTIACVAVTHAIS